MEAFVAPLEEAVGVEGVPVEALVAPWVEVPVEAHVAPEAQMVGRLEVLRYSYSVLER